MSDVSWYLYIIRLENGSLYTGITTDIDRRFSEHQSGKKGAKFLRGKGVLTLVYSCEVSDRSEASKLEAQVKKMSKSDKEKLISGGASVVKFFE